jgi:hypothetical protein
VDHYPARLLFIRIYMRLTASWTMFALSVLCAFGCGGGGGGSRSSFNGPLNAQGFPDVRGTYAVDFSALTGTCSDGSVGNIDFSSENVEITQSGENISVSRATNSKSVTIVTDSGANGTIDKDGNFSLKRSLVINDNGVPVNAVLHYSGQAFATGLAGDDQLDISLSAGSCTLNGTFSGNKLG